MSLSIPAPAVGQPLAEVELWSFDESGAIWKEEGTMALDAATNTYGATLAHLSWYNADIAVAPGCVRGRVVDCDGQPVSGLQVFASDPTISSMSTDETDRMGQYAVAGLSGHTLQLSVFSWHDPTYVSVSVVNGTTHPSQTTRMYWVTKNDPACLGQPDLVVFRQMGECPTGFVGGDAGPTDPSACFNANAVADAGAGDGGSLPDPWQDSCAAGLRGMFECWAPSGECHITVSETDSQVKFSNGSRVVWVVNEVIATGTLYGPNGELCGRMLGFSTGDQTEYTDAQGSVWTFNRTANTLTCPDGTIERLTGAQEAAMSGCSSSMTPSGGSNCSSGAIGSCGTDADCDMVAGMTCCQTKGGSMCVSGGEETCTSLQQQACASDADCTGITSTCCDTGMLKLCMMSCT